MPREVETETVGGHGGRPFSPAQLKQARSKMKASSRRRPRRRHCSTARSVSSSSTAGCWRRRPDPDVPLLERLRFLCIVSSNLDEFFEIRVAGLKAQIDDGADTPGPRWHSARPWCSARSRVRLTQLVSAAVRAVQSGTAARAREARASASCGAAEWTTAQREWIKDYFFRELMPVLTPIGLDPAHPFPRILNKSLNFAVAASRARTRSAASPASR